VKAAAETFRANPGVDVATAITELKVGEALVSLLQPDGSPSPVERTLIKPPRSRVGPITPAERATLRSLSPLGAKYDTPLNRESAAEKLAAKTAAATAATPVPVAPGRTAAAQPSVFDKMLQSAARSASSSIGRQVANEVGRQIFGTGRGSSSGGGLAGQLVRGVLGGLMRNL
jgi:Predicted ATPase